MKMMRAAVLAAFAWLACISGAQAQSVPLSTFMTGLPAASSLSGTEKMLLLQGGVLKTVNPSVVLLFSAMSGDCSMASPPSIVCTKTNGSAFAASAVVDATNAANISAGTLLAARMPALTGDCTTSVGAVATTCARTTATATNDNAAAGAVGEYVEARFTGATATVTVTIASPAVVTWTSPPYAGSATTGTNWTAPISFTTTGALPTGITAATTYWVIGNTLSGNTFQIATSVANALAATPINTSGTQSGTQTANSLQNYAATTTATDCAALQLTAGDWDVRGALYGDPTNASTSVTDVSAYLSQTLNTANTTPGYFGQIVGAAVVPGVAAVISVAVPPARFSFAGTSTVHFVGLSIFTVSTMSQYCGISARRPR